MRLVEVGDEAFYDFILVAWRDDYLRAGMERGQIVSVHVGNQFANGFCGRDVGGHLVVGLPLIYVQLFERDVGIGLYLAAHVVQAFEGSHAGCAHSYGLAVVLQQLFERCSAYAHVLGVHGVALNFFALYGFESACANV